MGNLTHEITLEEAWGEYLDNSDFRAIVQSGDFLYVGNRYVLNKPEFVHFGIDGRPELTKQAQQNLNECAILFRAVVIYEPSDPSMRGDSKSSTPKKRTAKHYDLNSQGALPKEIIELRERGRRCHEKQSAHIKTTWGRIYEYLQQEKANPQTFFQRTLLNSSYFTKAKNHDSSPPSMHIIISIVAGYDWGLHRAEELLKLAGHAFSPINKQHDAYLFAINSMYGFSIEDKNSIFIKEGLNPLGSATYSLDSENK